LVDFYNKEVLSKTTSVMYYNAEFSCIYSGASLSLGHLVSSKSPPEKLAEAQRRFATLQNELQSSLDAQRESSASGLGLRRRKTVFALSQKERCKHRNIKDLQLAFSEFYLSLILLQNYQVENNTQIMY
ncbi:Xenotropic and polytropic retrovirus receptor 1, partial [Xenoophorus captivus]